MEIHRNNQSRQEVNLLPLTIWAHAQTVAGNAKHKTKKQKKVHKMLNKSLILRSPEEDPLAMPAGSVDTSYPLLKGDKIYRFEISKLESVDAKKEGVPEGSQNLKISLATTQDERDTNGNVLHKGYVCTKYIPLYATGERTVADVRRDVATFIQAVEGRTSKTEMKAVRDNPDAFIGKPVDCKVGVSKGDSNFGPSNTIRFVPGA